MGDMKEIKERFMEIRSKFMIVEEKLDNNMKITEELRQEKSEP